MILLNPETRCLTVILLFGITFAVAAADKTPCQAYELETGAKHLILKIIDDLPANSYAFMLTSDKTRQPLIDTEKGFEIQQETGILYVIQAQTPLPELSAFALSEPDSRAASFINESEPRKLEALELKEFKGAVVCGLGL